LKIENIQASIKPTVFKPFEMFYNRKNYSYVPAKHDRDILINRLFRHHSWLM